MIAKTYQKVCQWDIMRLVQCFWRHWHKIRKIGDFNENFPVGPIHDILKISFDLQLEWDYIQIFDIIKVHILPEVCK